MRQIVLDTETTGIEISAGHRIIEIGCIELVNRKFTGKRYHQYINPEREIDEGALAVHGISKSFLYDKPLFRQIVHDFMRFIEGAELIIHNASFDVGFINHELNLAKTNWQNLAEYCAILDTLALARQLHMGQRNSLDVLCKRYNVDNSQRELHGALLDAHLLAQVYLAMTGGQSSLFEEPQMLHQNRDPQLVVSKAVKPKNLCVLKATEQELLAHVQRLQKIQEKGRCLWHELL